MTQAAYNHCWSQWAGAGCYWQVLVVIGRCWLLLAGAGCYRQVLTIAGKCWF